MVMRQMFKTTSQVYGYLLDWKIFQRSIFADYLAHEVVVSQCNTQCRSLHPPHNFYQLQLFLG